MQIREQNKKKNQKQDDQKQNQKQDHHQKQDDQKQNQSQSRGRLHQTNNPTKNANNLLVPVAPSPARRYSGCSAGLECFHLDLVIFTISGFLPGEYLLRVFPLICKSVKSRRLSLSLGSSFPLWSSPPPTTFYDLEGLIDDISGQSKPLQFIMDFGHVVTGLKVEAVTKDQRFPNLEKLSISSLLAKDVYFSFDQFPRLTKLEIFDGSETVKTILTWVWKLSLLELSLVDFAKGDDDDDDGDDDDGGALDSPAFAQTLRLLRVDDKRFLDALAPYCQSIQSLTIFGCHDAIVTANPGLTSLTVQRSFPGNPPIDLTQCTQLVELRLLGSCPFFSHGTHPQLVHVALENPDQGDASRFLLQCPSLKHVSLNGTWEDIVPIVTILDPTKCKRLTFQNEGQKLPSLDQVKRLILDRGFQINEEALLLYTSNGQEKWRKVMKMAPQIKDWTLLRGDWMDILFSHHLRPFLTSFNALSAIDIEVSHPWSEEMLSSAVQYCPVLKQLTVSGNEFWGGVQLHSSSLRKVDLQFNDNYSHFDLKLPSLVHLRLCGQSGEDLLLRGLLNGDPLIQLPLLSVLNISIVGGSNRRRTYVPCKVGHPSLTSLRVFDPSHGLAFSTLTIAKVPWLKTLFIMGLSTTTKVILRLVGSCDVGIGVYFHTDSDYQTQVYYDKKQQKWIEDGSSMERDEHQSTIKRPMITKKRRNKRR